MDGKMSYGKFYLWRLSTLLLSGLSDIESRLCPISPHSNLDKRLEINMSYGMSRRPDVRPVPYYGGCYPYDRAFMDAFRKIECAQNPSTDIISAYPPELIAGNGIPT